MFASAGGIGAAPSIPSETNVLTCSCLPGAVREGDEVGGGCAAGAVDAKGTATKDAAVAGAGCEGAVTVRGVLKGGGGTKGRVLLWRGAG